jgi:GNAT superfamily N-acetyltransferase
MLRVVRTTSDDPGFRSLVGELDAELRRRNGDVQAQYAPHNVIETLPTVVVVRDGERPVGCGCFKPFSREAVELKRMFVIPDARGRGIAGQVLDALERWAYELGFQTMVLETGTKNIEAIALYQRRGYAPIDRFGPYVDMPDSVCLSRSLGLRAD